MPLRGARRDGRGGARCSRATAAACQSWSASVPALPAAGRRRRGRARWPSCGGDPAERLARGEAGLARASERFNEDRYHERVDGESTGSVRSPSRTR